MGRATIIEGGDDGLYTVSIDYGSEIVQERSGEIQAKIDERQLELDEAEIDFSQAQSAVNSASSAVNSAITTYRNTLDPADRAAINERNAELLRLSSKRNQIGARRSLLKAQIADLQAELSRLQSVRVNEVREAWCADLTEDASGEVATIEIPGEIGDMIIAPTGREPVNDDGRMVARGVQSGNQVFYNAAILPGWQRFKHPYRVGTLTAVDGDVGVVNLDAATSSANDLQVRDEETIIAPIEYMDCNGAAFEADDRVVVDMRKPKVIGFESNPKPCGFTLYAFGLSGTAPFRSANGRTVKILPSKIQAFPGVYDLTLQTEPNFISISEWPGTRFAIHDRTTYKAEYSEFSDNRAFYAGNQLIYSDSSGRVPAICCTREKVFTALSGGESVTRTQIWAWDIESLSPLGQWQVAGFCSLNDPNEDNDSPYGMAASEDVLGIPVSCASGVTHMHWYNHSGSLLSWFQFSSPYRPMAICSDGKDFAISVEAVLGSDGAAEIWIYRNQSRIKTVFLDGTTGFGNRLVAGVAMTEDYLFASISQQQQIRVFDRNDDYALVAVCDFGNLDPVDLALDELLRPVP